MRKKLISIILSVVILVSIGSIFMNITASAETKNRPIKILAIGNSYSNNATEYISRIAESMGLDITAASLYQAGCPLKRHVAYYEAYETLSHDGYYSADNKNKYESLYINGGAISGKASIQEAIAYTDWDYITLQQMPDYCDDISSYWTEENPYLTKLYDYVLDELKKNGNKKCEILLHQGWSFSHAMSIDKAYKYYPVDYENTREFFEAIETTVDQAADIIKTHAGLKSAPEIVPSGKAVQLAKDEFGFGDTYGDTDSLYADYISHLSSFGKYLVGCVWVETFAKKAGLPVTDTRTTTFAPYGNGINDDVAAALRSCAHEAVTGEANTVYGDWRAVPEGNGLKITHFMGKVPANGKVTVPAKIEGKRVCAVSDNAFKYVKGVTEIIREEIEDEPASSTVTSSSVPSESEPTSSSAPSSEAQSSSAEGQSQNGGTGILLYVIFGILAAAAIAVAVVFLVIKKKNS